MKLTGKVWSTLFLLSQPLTDRVVRMTTEAFSRLSKEEMAAVTYYEMHGSFVHMNNHVEGTSWTL